MATRSITAELIDHAGAYYEWFQYVALEGDRLVIEGNESLTEDAGIAGECILSPADVQAAVETLNREWGGAGYEGRFFSDMANGKFDDADGDMNAVDMVLQTAMWGSLIFG